MCIMFRALVVGRVTGSNASQLVKRELTVTFMVGACGSVVAATFAWAISGSFAIAAVMMAAMICNMLIGAALGVLIPMLRDRFGKDPAMGSSVLLTFATDSLGFFVFLGLATLFLIYEKPPGRTARQTNSWQDLRTPRSTGGRRHIRPKPN